MLIAESSSHAQEKSRGHGIFSDFNLSLLFHRSQSPRLTFPSLLHLPYGMFSVGSSTFLHRQGLGDQLILNRKNTQFSLDSNSTSISLE